MPFFSKLITGVGYAVQFGCILHCVVTYLGDIVLCSGPSMEPTIFSNDVLLTEHITAQMHNLSLDDIVISKCPNDPKVYVCKRVKGLPGDTIWTGFATYHVVPKGHIWLQGDNDGNSTDSRNYGPISQSLIRSRVLMKIWPLKDLTILTNNKTS